MRVAEFIDVTCAGEESAESTGEGRADTRTRCCE